MITTTTHSASTRNSPTTSPHDHVQLPPSTNSRPQMYTDRQERLLFHVPVNAMKKPDPKTGEWTLQLVASPPCTLIGDDGVTPPKILPSGRGGGEHRCLAVHDPYSGFTSRLGDESPTARSVASRTLTTKSIPNYVEESLARRRSIRLPQRLKDDHRHFTSPGRSRLSRICSRIRHPKRYQRYAEAERLLASRSSNIHSTFNDVSVSASVGGASNSSGMVYYPRISDEPFEKEPLSCFSARTDEPKPPRLQKSTRALNRDIFKVLKSSGSNVKVRLLDLITNGKCNSHGERIRGRSRTKKTDGWVVEDKLGEPFTTQITTSELKQQRTIDAPPPSPSLLLRFTERALKPHTGRRLVKKRSEDTLNSLSPSVSFTNDLDRADPMGNEIKHPLDTPVQSGASHPRLSTSPSRSPPITLSPDSPYPTNAPTEDCEPPKLVLAGLGSMDWGDWRERASPASEAGHSWTSGGPTLNESEAGSLSAVDSHGQTLPRSSAASIIAGMQRRDTGASDMSGSTAAGSVRSQTDCTKAPSGHKKNWSERREPLYVLTAATQGTRHSKRSAVDLTSSFWARFDAKKQADDCSSDLSSGCGFSKWQEDRDTSDTRIGQIA